MLLPGVVVHFGGDYSDEHEQLLYNTVRFQLQEVIRAYLDRARRPYPIHLLFDMREREAIIFNLFSILLSLRTTRTTSG